ncbi:MAG: DUF1987 domain-containing protein [Bacteroidales bacterium]|jgi:hypothetical protein|nr:DUF1987 domain-containing protein [Bacteroidales bacterium]MBR4115834.1 DUF1987 domain-containing protein [Bacteroidales bacterium]MBR6266200.1 DUF1987 domain-containing protein [Bacteroidales bacterium]MCR4801260.1 DUF1987 domain-containing protein [Bacteroidales bacterium]
MNNIKMEGTAKTPDLSFDANTGVFDIKGRSIPENSVEFYKPILEWIDEYTKQTQPKTIVNIHLEYFNTSSSKCILDLLKKFEIIAKNGNDIVIRWHYEEDDEDMLEAGQDYQSIIKVPFEMVEVDE